MCYLAGHDELAGDLARHLARAQQLGRLQRGAVRGDDLAPGRQLQRLARAQAGQLQAAAGQLDGRAAQLDVLGLDVGDADGGGLVGAAAGGGQDDLLGGGAPLAGQRLGRHHAGHRHVVGAAGRAAAAGEVRGPAARTWSAVPYRTVQYSSSTVQ